MMQLQKLHHALFHANASKKYNLLKHADPKKLRPDTLDVRKQIGDACHRCQTLANAPKFIQDPVFGLSCCLQ
jgi:hypothetical protein